MILIILVVVYFVLQQDYTLNCSKISSFTYYASFYTNGVFLLTK